ncbi:hypothetical protein BIW11_10284, partial [Tropilaelaps mercedesae]
FVRKQRALPIFGNRYGKQRSSGRCRGSTPSRPGHQQGADANITLQGRQATSTTTANLTEMLPRIGRADGPRRTLLTVVADSMVLY